MNAPAENPSEKGLEHGFTLGELEIGPHAGEVAGPGGREKLDPKVMDVLVMLAQNAGQVVLREDLLARLWPNTVVTDESLTRCIYELRRQLSLAGGDERYKAMLETVPKRGYRLNGTVAPAIAETSTVRAARSRRHWAAAVAVVAAIAVAVVLVGRRTVEPPAAPARKSIAVLPFVDMSAGQDQRYFSDGIAEEILNKLSQSEDLLLISRTSSFLFRDRPFDIPTIADKLKVTHVLEGSVRRTSDDVRITVQLIEVSSNSHLWSHTYARKVDDLFAVQEEIATSVSTALNARLATRAPEARMPASFEAYERFLAGEFFYYRRAPRDIERAIGSYEAAIAIDPAYARAWAALAGANAYLASISDPPSPAYQEKQGIAARKAVELAPSLSIAHRRLSQFYFDSLQPAKALEHLRRATALDPGDPLILADAAGNAIERGDFEAAISLQRRALAQDPLSAVMRINLAVFLLGDGRRDEALSEFRRVIEINPDAGPNTEVEIARILILQKRYDEAAIAVAALPEGTYRDHASALLQTALGNTAEADDLIRRLTAQAADNTDQSPDDLVSECVRLAETLAFRGKTDEAFAVLEGHLDEIKARNKNSQYRWFLRNETRISPFLKVLHADPRWEAFLRSDD